MLTFLLTLTVFAIGMVAMAIGVIVSNRELHGSCGGPDSDDCLCALEKRRLCALAAKAERAHQQRTGSSSLGVADMSYADMTRLMDPDKHEHKCDHKH